MPTPKTPPSQIDVIDALLPVDVTMTVRGKSITLTVPTEAAVRKLRKVQASVAPSDGAEPDLEALADAALTLASGAVRACLPGLDAVRAFRLVLASGGEAGELSRTALELCGIGAG
ncbi:MAG: hypothetical protein F4156_09865, partial [Holophagales bacterium]|nr:hypothetical protein [Holophagales bacterium]